MEGVTISTTTKLIKGLMGFSIVISLIDNIDFIKIKQPTSQMDCFKLREARIVAATWATVSLASIQER